MHIYDLNWMDIVYPNILPYLSYHDWISLKCTSKEMYLKMAVFWKVNYYLSDPIGSESLFKCMTKNASRLRVLNLSNATWVKDAHLRPVLSQNQHLKKIDLTNCRGLSQGILQILTVKCVELEELWLGGCGWVKPFGLKYLVDHHKNLKATLSMDSSKTMSISAREAATDSPLTVMGKYGLRTIPQERKKSKYTGKDDLYQKITDPDAVGKITSSYSKHRPILRQGRLCKLDVSNSPELCDTTFENFFDQFHMITLLNIGGNPQLSDLTMCKIARNLHQLKFLNICDNPLISDKGLYTVGKYCSNLREVKASGCFRITRRSISFLEEKGVRVQSMAANNPQLSALVVKPSFLMPSIPKHIIDMSLHGAGKPPPHPP